MNYPSSESIGQPFLRPVISIDAFGIISDVVVTLTAELDRRTIQFQELVKLEAGAVVVLNRPAGENIDVLVGESFIGSGEILVIDGALAIRVADLRDKQTTTPRIAESFDEESAAA